MMIAGRQVRRHFNGTLRAQLFLYATALTTMQATCAAVAQNAPEYSRGSSAEQPLTGAKIAFTIPSGELGTSLTAWAETSKMRLLISTEALSGLRAKGVTGNHTPEKALLRLLRGTGLVYRLAGIRTITIMTQEAAAMTAHAQAISLDTINVESEGTNGFVATNSSAGTKTNTPIIETPQTINVVTRDQLNVQKPQSVPQALHYTPGVVTDRNGADQRIDYLFMRGFAVDQYLNGMRLIGGSGGYAVPQIDPYFLDRIEVMKGPASVLYGQASPGGIVNLVSKRPTAETIREVQLQTGNFDRLQGAFDFGGKLDKDGQLLYRLTGLGRSTDTQVDFSKEERFAIAPALTWKPNSDTTLTVLTSLQHDPSIGNYNQLPARGTVLPNPNGNIPTSFYSGDPNFDTQRRTQYSAGYLFEHRFSDMWTVRQNLRYTHIDSQMDFIYQRGLQADLRALNRSTNKSSESNDGLTIDNQAQGTFNVGESRHTLLLGVDYQRSLSDLVYGNATTTPLNFLNPIYYQPITSPPTTLSQDQKTNQTGVYLQDQIRLGNWAFTFEGRHDWYDSRTNNRLTSISTTQVDEATTGRAGIVYLFENGLRPTSVTPRHSSLPSAQILVATPSNRQQGSNMRLVSNSNLGTSMPSLQSHCSI